MDSEEVSNTINGAIIAALLTILISFVVWLAPKLYAKILDYLAKKMIKPETVDELNMT